MANISKKFTMIFRMKALLLTLLAQMASASSDIIKFSSSPLPPTLGKVKYAKIYFDLNLLITGCNVKILWNKILQIFNFLQQSKMEKL